MKKIRKGDKVIVIAGKDKGKQSTVIGFENFDKILVKDINKVKKHVRPNPNRNEVGGIVEKENAMHISNIAILNPVQNKADRVGFRYNESGIKVRFFRSDGTLIDS